MTEDTCGEVVVDRANGRVLADEVLGEPDLPKLPWMLRYVPRLPPIHDEQRRDRHLPVSILPRPVLAPRLGAQVETFGLNRPRQQRQK